MGRQKGQSSRTKGNVKPSSSSRAAEVLLANQSKAATFETFSGELAYVPVSKLKDDEVGLPPEFRLVLTKLSKKDATTKLKALSELVSLCKDNDKELLLQVLPFWTRHFNRLCYEKDRRVREAGQVAMCTLAHSCGKEIAPYLKKLVGWWWISQNDFYSPAAKAASDGFLTAFSTEEKQRKALLFCHQEILKLIDQNLFITDLRQLTGTTKEEDFVEQLMASTLKALASFINKISSSEKNEKAKSTIAEFFNNPRFWKFHKHKNSMVKRVYYHVIAETCQSLPQLLHDHLPVMHKSIFHMLNDKDGIVMKFIWNAANVVTAAFDDWYQYVDIRAGFLPQLYGSMQNGFHGFASQVCRFVPLIVGRFPPEIRSDIEVYKKLFQIHDEIINRHEGVRRSAAETKAFVTSLVECHQHVLFDATLNKDEELVRLCVDDLLTWFAGYVRSCEDFALNKYAWKYYFQVFVIFLQNLAAKCGESESLARGNADLWKGILEPFRRYVAESLSDNQHELTGELLSLINRYNHFFEYFNSSGSGNHSTGNYRALTSKKVKFSDLPTAEKTASASTGKKNFTDNMHLMGALRDIFQSTLSVVENVQFKLVTFRTIFGKFVDAELFEVCGAAAAASSNPPTAFLVGHLLPLLRSSACSDLDLLSSFDFIYSCLLCCDDEGAVLFLDDLFEGENLNRLKLAMGGRILNDDKCPLSIRDWLRSPQNKMVAFVLDSAAVQFCEDDTFWRMLRSAFTPWKGSTAELKFDRSCILSIIDRTNTLLVDADGDTVNILLHNFHLISSCLTFYLDDFVVDVFRLYQCAISEMFTLLLYPNICDGLMLLTEADEYLKKLLVESHPFMTSSFLVTCASCVREEIIHSRIGFDDAIALMQVIVRAYRAYGFAHDALTDKLLLTQAQWNALRKNFDSPSWVSHSQLLQGRRLHQCDWKEANDEKHTDDYASVVQIYSTLFDDLLAGVDVKIEARAMVAKEVLMVSLLFGDGDELKRGWMHTEDLSSFLVEEIVRKSVDVGNGWNILFESSLLHFPRLQHIAAAKMEELMANLPTSSAVNSLLVYISQIDDTNKLSKMAEVLQTQFCDLDVAHENFKTSALTLTVLSAIFRKLPRDSATGDFEKRVLETLDKMMTWKQHRGMMEDWVLTEQRDANLIFTLACLSVFNEVAVCLPQAEMSLNSEQWDFTLCGLVTWFHSLENSLAYGESLKKIEFYLLLYRLCQLMKLFDGYLTSELARKDPALPASLVNEWSEFYSCNANQSLLAVYFATTTNPKFRFSDALLPVMAPLLKTVTRETLLRHAERLKRYLVPGSCYDTETSTVLRHASKHFVSSSCYDRLIAHRLARKILCHPARMSPRTPPFVVMETLRSLSTALDPYFEHLSSMEARRRRQLQHHRRVTKAIDDSDDNEAEQPLQEELEEEEDEDDDDSDVDGEIEKNVDAVINYFLVWKLLLEQISYIPIEQRHYYTTELNYYSSTSVISSLLPRLHALLPVQPKTSDGGGEQWSLFQRDVDEELELDKDLLFDHVVCATYKQLLQSLPAMVRCWYQQLDKNSRNFVDSYTSEHVSPIISRHELLAVAAQQQPDGLEIQTRIQAREVVAAYRISDAEFEIVVQLPTNYPLEPVKLDTLKRAGIPIPQWRYWILQMTSLLHQQNGRILDALLLWQGKVNKRLDGIEECMICFSVVHGTGQTLPKLTCKTCEKKYHGECLYKWFDTSNQSTCPLCRSSMTFPS